MLRVLHRGMSLAGTELSYLDVYNKTPREFNVLFLTLLFIHANLNGLLPLLSYVRTVVIPLVVLFRAITLSSLLTIGLTGFGLFMTLEASRFIYV
jgi:hypothetical protein